MCNLGGSTTARGGLPAVLAAVEQLRAEDCGALSHTQLGEQLIGIRHAIDMLELAGSAVAAAFARNYDPDSEMHGSAVAWIRQECHTSSSKAFRAITVGGQAATLPQGIASMVAGRISFDHVALLAQTAEAVRTSPTSGPFDETALVRRAEQHTLLRFGNDCAHVRHATDAQDFLQMHRLDVESRRLTVYRHSEGGMHIRGYFDDVSGATIATTLGALARRTGPDDARDRDRRQADALVELCSHGTRQRTRTAARGSASASTGDGDR